MIEILGGKNNEVWIYDTIRHLFIKTYITI